MHTLVRGATSEKHLLVSRRTCLGSHKQNIKKRSQIKKFTSYKFLQELKMIQEKGYYDKGLDRKV